MTDERTTEGDTTPDDVTGERSWDRREMDIDDPKDAPRTTATPDELGAPHWNKGQLAEEHADGSGGPHAEGIDPVGGLSGEGSNPGGGERWADRDR